MKTKLTRLSLLLLALLALPTACTEDIDTSDRYVFRERTVMDYLEAHPRDYSEFVRLTREVKMSSRSETSVYQVLTARGNYTCFAPTNEAIRAYLDSLVSQELIAEPSWEAFTDSGKLDSIRCVVVRNAIMDGGDLETQRFTVAQFPVEQNAEFPIPTLHDTRLTVSWPKGRPDKFMINGEVQIDERNRDIMTLNGVIHQIHSVIAPKDKTAARYFQEILDNRREGYLLMARCLQACGLLDTLSKVRDEVYEHLYQTGQIPNFEKYKQKGYSDMSGDDNSDAIAPEHRKIGFTIFAEPDSYWRSQGLDPHSETALEELRAWIKDHGQTLPSEGYTDDDRYTSPRNMLYQWTTYHILPMRLQANKLVHHCNEIGYSSSNPLRYTLPVMEWYTTMGDRRLLKLYESHISQGVYINRFPQRDNRRKGSGYEISCDPDKTGCLVDRTHHLAVVNDVSNACIYPIDKPLAYNQRTADLLGTERIRFDGMALFPEAATNGIRRAESTEDRFQHVYIPSNSIYQYFSNMSILSDDTHFIYFNGYKINWPNYCQDEMKGMGHFDLIFTLPPVPKRTTYELRYKTLATPARGVVQVYFGDNIDNLPPAGIPIDMTKSCSDNFGERTQIADTGDDDIDADTDHKLRNHGIMRSAKHEEGGREGLGNTRHIIARQTLDPHKTYYVRFKSVLDSNTKEFYMDYMEWCPKEVYDNPEQPEDIW